MVNRKEYMKKYYQKNKEYLSEKHREYMKEYREENKEQILEYNREYSKRYAKSNPKKIKESLKKWRGKNKEHIKEYNKKYVEKNPEYRSGRYKENKEKVLKQNKKWRDNNIERFKIYMGKWYKTEKGKALIQRGNCRRQARERKMINTLTSKEWLEILEKYNYRCAYCGVEFDCENLPTKDHIIPISKGGDNIKENIVPACKSCNSRKNNKMIFKEINYKGGENKENPRELILKNY